VSKPWVFWLAGRGFDTPFGLLNQRRVVVSLVEQVA
jgi:hypothetical protein